jgi:hypothetical protein
MHYTVEFSGTRGRLYTQLSASYTFADTTLPRTITLTLSPGAEVSIDLIDITALQVIGLSCETGSVRIRSRRHCARTATVSIRRRGMTCPLKWQQACRNLDIACHKCRAEIGEGELAYLPLAGSPSIKSHPAYEKPPPPSRKRLSTASQQTNTASKIGI